MQILKDVKYILEWRKNLIFLGTLQENDVSYKYDGYKDIMKVRKSVSTVITTRRIACNIYKLLGRAGEVVQHQDQLSRRERERERRYMSYKY